MLGHEIMQGFHLMVCMLPSIWILSRGQDCRLKGRSHGANEGCANRCAEHLKDGVGKASDKGDSSSNEEAKRLCWIEVASCTVSDTQHLALPAFIAILW